MVTPSTNGLSSGKGRKQGLLVLYLALLGLLELSTGVRKWFLRSELSNNELYLYLKEWLLQL